MTEGVKDGRRSTDRGMVPGPSAQAASCLIDIMGAEVYAEEATAWVCAELAKKGPALTVEQEFLVRLGAIKGAQVVAAEVRDFSGRDPGG